MHLGPILFEENLVLAIPPMERNSQLSVTFDMGWCNLLTLANSIFCQTQRKTHNSYTYTQLPNRALDFSQNPCPMQHTPLSSSIKPCPCLYWTHIVRDLSHDVTIVSYVLSWNFLCVMSLSLLLPFKLLTSHLESPLLVNKFWWQVKSLPMIHVPCQICFACVPASMSLQFDF